MHTGMRLGNSDFFVLMHESGGMIVDNTCMYDMVLDRVAYIPFYH